MSDEATPSIVHIAGLDVAVDGRYRQRCAWCGAMLDDIELANVAVLASAVDTSPPSWPVGALVAISGGHRWVVPYTSGDSLPAQSCTSLDPTVTV